MVQDPQPIVLMGFLASLKDNVLVMQNAGYDVTVFNRTTSKAEKWASNYKGQFAKTVEETKVQKPV